MRLLVCLVIAFAGLAPAAMACDTRRTSSAVQHRPAGERPPLILGDSTMILAARGLGRRGLAADARGCRQFPAGVALLARRKRLGRLPRVAILALGANGPVSQGAVRRAVRVMGPDRILGLVTPRKSPRSAAALRRAARRFPNRVLLIDWVGFSAGHGGWFAGDGLHLSFTGARAFAGLVRRAVAPLVHPPVRALRLDRSELECGRVVVTHGGDRVTCPRARQLAGLPLLRPIPGWRTFDLRGARPRWDRAVVRRDRRVVVAVKARAAGARAAAVPGLRILATGDSMMLLTDRQLRAALAPAGRAVVTSDVRVATGLTKPHLFDWLHYAPRQMRRRSPDVVVAAMGANEAFPIGRAPCCGVAWRMQYAKRVERLSAAWRRGGARHVYWLTLPEPVPGFLTPRFTGVNAAVRRARGVGVIDTRPLLTPDGVFVSEKETAPGRVEKIRADDGVHVWWPGARLVAEAIVARLEADGVLAR